MQISEELLQKIASGLSLRRGYTEAHAKKVVSSFVTSMSQLDEGEEFPLYNNTYYSYRKRNGESGSFGYSLKKRANSLEIVSK